MEGRALAIIVGSVVAAPERTATGYRIRVVVTERTYDRRTRTKTERSSWLWVMGLGEPPVLKKGDVVAIEANIRSIHEDRDEMLLEATRILPTEANDRRSHR
jgi:single-stranded DNA-binding protein